MASKTMRENYYQKLLEYSHRRHKKVNSGTISTSIERKVNWDRLSEHFKNLTKNGKNGN